MNGKSKIYLEEEKPIIELPGLIILGIAFFSILLGLSLLFLPLIIVIAIFAGSLLILAIFFRPVIGLFILFFCIYAQPFEFIPALRPFHLTRILSFVVLFTWIIKMMVFRNVRIVKSPHNLFAIAFVGLAALSLIQNFDYFFPWLLEFIKVIILYFLVANLIGNRRYLLEFAWVLIVVSLILAAIGIFEYYSGRPILYYAAEREVVSGEGIYRVAGTRGEHGEFAIYLVIAVPLILGFFFYVKSIILKMLLFLPLSLVSLAIVLSFSRAGMLALATVLFLSVLKQRKTFFTLTFLFLLIFAVALLFIPPEYWEHIHTLTNLQDPTIQARINIYKAAWQAILDNPIVGVGFRSFYYHSYKYAPAEAVETGFFTPHNIFIEVTAENGIVGLAILLGIIICVFKNIRSAARNFQERHERLLLTLVHSIQISFIGYLTGYMFLAPGGYTYNFWILIGLSVALKHLSEQIADEHQ